MPNRIIDQTESFSISGAESIPGTQQTSTGETTPKNVRWTWNTVLAWLRSNLGYYELTKIVFSGAGSSNYQVSRYEKVIGCTFVQVSGTDTIKISNNASSEIYIDTTNANSGDINYYSTDSTATNRVLKIELSAAGTVYIHSIKNLIP